MKKNIPQAQAVLYSAVWIFLMSGHGQESLGILKYSYGKGLGFQALGLGYYSSPSVKYSWLGQIFTKSLAS
jgi:hypothetical protein